jgi:predicted Zn-dependent protease
MASISASGRRCRSSGLTAAAPPIFARWSGSTSRSWSARATAWRPGRTARAAVTYEYYLDPANWRRQVDEALRQALVNLGSVPAPAGEMTVVLGPGWPGVMLHEAVGHGLEGDFNRKQTSTFSGMIGQQVAAKGVNVVDDGTIPTARLA